jgi:hypothetical protein
VELSEGRKCIWVETKTREDKCTLIESSCSNILEREICEHLGSVVDNNEIVVGCIWLNKNETEPNVQCVDEV